MKTPHLLLLLWIITLSLSGCVYPDPYYGGYYGGYYGDYYRDYYVSVPRIEVGYGYAAAPSYYHGYYGHHGHCHR